jgi:hypothetical protein
MPFIIVIVISLLSKLPSSFALAQDDGNLDSNEIN